MNAEVSSVKRGWLDEEMYSLQSEPTFYKFHRNAQLLDLFSAFPFHHIPLKISEPKT